LHLSESQGVVYINLLASILSILLSVIYLIPLNKYLKSVGYIT